MQLTESEKKLWLEGNNGLTPYLRMKDNGMPRDKINQIAWLLLNGSGCGFCKVCRDEPCNIKDGEKCTINIANYIRKIVLEEKEQEIRNKAIDEFAKWCYVNGIDFSYMHKATDTEPFCKRVIDRFNEEQRKEGAV